MQFVRKNPDNVLFVEEETPAKKDHSRLFRRLAVVGVLLVVVIAALLILGSQGLLSAERIALKSFDAGKKKLDENLPFSLNGIKVSSVDAMGDCFCVLDELEYTIYSPEGNELCAFKHNMSSPVSVTSSRRALLYERGNYTFAVWTRKGELFRKTEKNAIITADMNARNEIITVTTDERALGVVTVYDKNGDEKLCWRSADRYVADAVLSPDGKRFAVLLLTVKNGETNTDVCFFDVGKTEPSATVSFEKETLFDLRVLDDDRFVAVGTESAVFFDGGRQTGVYRYTDELAFFTVADGEAALLFSPAAGETTLHGVTLDEKAAVTATFETADVSFFSATESGDLLLCGGAPTRLRRNGDTFKKEEVKLPPEAGETLRLTKVGGRLFALTVNGLFLAE